MSVKPNYKQDKIIELLEKQYTLGRTHKSPGVWSTIQRELSEKYNLEFTASDAAYKCWS